MSDRRELIAVKVMREQQWAYERRLEHLSYRQMRIASNRPESEGGLGYDLSEHALKGLVRGYRERMHEVAEVDLDEQRERQAAELEQLAQLARAGLAKGAAAGVIDHDAAKLLLAVHKREAELFGTDAPRDARIHVSGGRDVVAEELEALLAQLDPETPAKERNRP